MKNYYLHDGKEQHGPYNEEELKQKAIGRDTLVWTEGMEDWKKAGELEDLKAFFAAIPPPLKSVEPPPFKKDNKEDGAGIVKKYKVLVISVLTLMLVVGVAMFMYNKVKDDAVEDAMEKVVENQEVQERDVEAEKHKQIEERKLYIRNHIDEYFSAKSSYYADAFGGITNALVTFYNNSEYPIDEAVVRVTYIKDNGAIWTTHDVTLTNIAAKGSNVERSQDSNRGTKLSTEIISIKSQALNLCYSGVTPGVDPYLCY